VAIERDGDWSSQTARIMVKRGVPGRRVELPADQNPSTVLDTLLFSSLHLRYINQPYDEATVNMPPALNFPWRYRGNKDDVSSIIVQGPYDTTQLSVAEVQRRNTAVDRYRERMRSHCRRFGLDAHSTTPYYNGVDWAEQIHFEELAIALQACFEFERGVSAELQQASRRVLSERSSSDEVRTRAETRATTIDWQESILPPRRPLRGLYLNECGVMTLPSIKLSKQTAAIELGIRFFRALELYAHDQRLRAEELLLFPEIVAGTRFPANSPLPQHPPPELPLAFHITIGGRIVVHGVDAISKWHEYALAENMVHRYLLSLQVYAQLQCERADVAVKEAAAASRAAHLAATAVAAAPIVADAEASQ